MQIAHIKGLYMLPYQWLSLLDDLYNLIFGGRLYCNVVFWGDVFKYFYHVIVT